MNVLTPKHFLRLLKSIEILNSGIDTESLETRLISSTFHLIDNDISAFEAFKLSGEYLGIIVFEPVNSISAKDLEIYMQLVHEHPLYQAVMVENKLFSDPLVDTSLSPGFIRTNIYNDYYRPVGVEHQLSHAFQVNDEAFVTCAINRSNSPFTAAEREMLNLFRPHIAAAIRHAWLMQGIEARETTLLGLMDKHDIGAITLGSDMKIKTVSSRAISILARFFDKEAYTVHGLPVKLWNWVSMSINSANSSANSTFIVENELETVTAELAIDQATRVATILFKAKKKISATTLKSLGLSTSEAKILYFVVLGKTNEQIALLNSISPRTVQKHVENICDKLGVPNRTAAAVRATELI